MKNTAEPRAKLTIVIQNLWVAGLLGCAFPELPASGASAQQAYLKASNTGAADAFAYSVAVSGDTLVIGAPQEDSAATGPNGNPNNNSGPDSGAVYVFVRSQGIWTQQAYLKPSNTGVRDSFGWSVAVSGNTILVGALTESSSATGVNGDGANNLAPQSGAAYVFVRAGTSWSQQAYLKASNTGRGDQFGYAVAVSGNTALVGARSEASNATGVNGNQLDNTAAGAGAAYVFVRAGTNWTQQAYLKASNTSGGDAFGWSVALSADLAIVGAPNEDSHAAGVDGNPLDDSAPQSGAAYVFARVGTTWTQQAYLKASNPDPDDLFGYSVAASGETVLVGAYQESSLATGVNGNQADNSATNAGAAYVYVRSGTTWSQQAYLKASNTGLPATDPATFPPSNDGFGFSVAIVGNLIVIGAPQESSNATGINGDQGNNSLSSSGAAYVYIRTGTTWSHEAYLKASNTGSGDLFGFSVAVSGDTAVVGAVGESSKSTGVNGDQEDNTAGFAGAAYAFNGLGSDPCLSVHPKLGLFSDGGAGHMIRGVGAPGCACRLQRAAQVNGPWENLATLTPGANGTMEFHDASALPGQAFYRTVQP